MSAKRSRMEESHEPTQDAEQKAASAGILHSHGISLNIPAGQDKDGAPERPPAVKHMSSPAYQSPIRHHRRSSSRTKHVKETLNAHSHYGSSSDDGAGIFQVNQYTIKQEIGRGSFGSVHLATDQYGQEYAVKEFSKSRLRKRAQSSLLRRPGGKKNSSHFLTASGGFNAPISRTNTGDWGKGSPDVKNSLDLIKEEIAIMKKLNHNNLVSLIEVLDDPEEDSLYMVLEICKKGVVMKVGLEEQADPYDDETCRCWFRDMILGIEYLHHQGIIHRDLKPDNCLITNDDVLKIVDFGVSEMFERDSEMHTAKSAGSPAFMPPELCVARHGDISGKPADIWSMGVTLYCLRFGKIPFERTGMLELYEAIRDESIDLHEETDKNFIDVIGRLLEKDPNKRITMKELRDHPWVTKNGEDPLLSEDENCADIITPPTEQEKNQAITGSMGHLMVVMKAVKRFKKLLTGKRPELMESILGRDSRITAPPSQLRKQYTTHRSKSQQDFDRKPLERALTVEGIHHEMDVDMNNVVKPRPVDSIEGSNQPAPSHDNDGNPALRKQISDGRALQSHESSTHHPAMRRAQTFSPDGHTRGHAHDPLLDTLFLSIGSGIDRDDTDSPYTISESPVGTEENVYELAYKEEMDKILERRGRAATMYLTRRVEHKSEIRQHHNVIGATRAATLAAFGGGSSDHAPASGFANMIQKARENANKDAASKKESQETPDVASTNDSQPQEGHSHGPVSGFADLVRKAREHVASDSPNSESVEGQKDEPASTEPSKSREDS